MSERNTPVVQSSPLATTLKVTIAPQVAVTRFEDVVCAFVESGLRTKEARWAKDRAEQLQKDKEKLN